MYRKTIFMFVLFIDWPSNNFKKRSLFIIYILGDYDLWDPVCKIWEIMYVLLNF